MELADFIIVGCTLFGLAFAFFLFSLIKKVSLTDDSLASKGASEETPEGRVPVIYARIVQGAKVFLREEYKVAGIFCLVFAGIIKVFITNAADGKQGTVTAISFLVGATTSMACGYLGMMVATFSNARTTLGITRDLSGGYKEGFNTAFRGGAVMGYALCSLGVLVLWILLQVMKPHFKDDMGTLMDCVAGYGLGGSTVAMFGRVGGGIYTKAADVGADLVGKVVAGLEEDDPRNPATIADNVGDNVGDIAGMGADLFGSFAESTCAALVISSSLNQAGWTTLMFPVLISALGIPVCAAISFLATDIAPVKSMEGIENNLKIQMVVTAVAMLPTIFFLAKFCIPEEGFDVPSLSGTTKIYASQPTICAVMGTVGGLVIGLITEYFTSHTFTPTQELATACKSGTAVNIIFGMALGYKSCIIPVFVLAAAIYVSFTLCSLYGVALAALGMLSTLTCGLTIDGFGPISDNAGGIAEMAEFPPSIRDRTDALDAAGNTTAAIGKGFAIGSAALVSLALYGAFVVRCAQASPGETTVVNILDPKTFAAGLIGAMIPYWFAALTMKSVGKAAGEMVQEVTRQFTAVDSKGKTLLTGSTELSPDYDRCIAISTTSSVKEMIAPGALVIGSPLFFGVVFGKQAAFGLLTGSLFSSVQLAVSMSNSGGAWDNCKKYIKGEFADDLELCWGEQPGKNTKKPTTDAEKKAAPKAREVHDAAVQGDTVGDPFKDTSGPALNIVMKLQAIVCLVFAQVFLNVEGGQGLINKFTS